MLGPQSKPRNGGGSGGFNKPKRSNGGIFSANAKKTGRQGIALAVISLNTREKTARTKQVGVEVEQTYCPRGTLIQPRNSKRKPDVLATSLNNTSR